MTGMPARFPVPDACRDDERWPQRQPWCDRLPGIAEAMAQRWRLTPDGSPMFGFLSVVWPVRGDTGRPMVLKIHDHSPGTDGERLALEAAQGDGLVQLLASEPTMNALLLQRLDAARTLESPEVDVDTACELIGDIVARVSSRPAPSGLRCVADVADGLHASTTAMLDRTPAALPRGLADRGLETLKTVAAQARAAPQPLPLVHGDLGYQNVLHTLPETQPAWVAIDPLPAAGQPEWEVAPAIRNRWEDAVASGDADRALRRRFDIICERASLDRELARRILQAIAVDNVLWLSMDDGSANGIQRSFLAPYSLVARW